MRPPRRERLDVLLVARGFFETREKARRAIMAGAVLVAEQRIDKPGTAFPEDAVIRVREAERYVGRGGLKMEGALRAFGIDPTGWTCLDIGASTGGFTDCLLQHGARKVWAVDVGCDQLDWKIRSHPQVVVREKYNARHLLAEDFGGDRMDLLVADVSFISLTLIIGPALAVLRPGALLVPLIKPQFELKREEVGRGGIVKDPLLHETAVARVRDHCVVTLGLEWIGVIESPIKGGEGNTEFLACLRYHQPPIVTSASSQTAQNPVQPR
jgi:23S rRNA (cytidine1920-2'-O)/16S rRNA (cytidine1409-2'-O)-methyltransferase